MIDSGVRNEAAEGEHNSSMSVMAAYTGSLDAVCYQEQDYWMDFGVYYTTNDPNVQFRWLEYNVQTQQWKVIQNWSSSNWVSWKTNYGDYWLQCEMKTSDGQVRYKTVTHKYYAGRTRIKEVCIEPTAEGDGTYRLGATSMLSSGVKFSVLIYDTNAKTWKTLVYRNSYSWTDWVPKTGSYWVRFEVYTPDGRMGEEKTFTRTTREPVRRALLLGETSTNQVPISDVNNMYSLNNQSSFYGTRFNVNTSFANKTKRQILDKIQSVFANTTENDVSYLYFTCHGGLGGTLYLTTSSTATFTPAELRTTIDKYIKGKVVIMIDSCYSGGAINKSVSDSAEHFAEDFIEEFYASKSGELAADRFQVLCASRKDETSLGGSVISLATRFWLRGAGWNYETKTACNLEADVDGDDKVTLKELYQYSYDKVKEHSNNRQHVVCSPANSEFVLYGRY